MSPELLHEEWLNKDLYEWNTFIYNMRLNRCRLKDSWNDENKYDDFLIKRCIDMYKENFDIIVTKQNIQDKPYLLFIIDLFNIKDHIYLPSSKDLHKLIFYDEKMLIRLSNMYRLPISRIFTTLLYKQRFNNETIEFTEVRQPTLEDKLYFHLSNEEKLDLGITAISLRFKSNNLDPRIKSIRYLFDDVIYNFPPNVTHITGDIELNKNSILPDSLTHLEVYTIMNTILPNGLIHLEAVRFNTILPSNLKSLKLDSDTERELPSSLEYLSGVNPNKLLPNLRYLECTEKIKPEYVPNLIVLINDKIDYDIRSLTKLLVLHIRDVLPNYIPTSVLLYRSVSSRLKTGIPNHIKYIDTYYLDHINDNMEYVSVTKLKGTKLGKDSKLKELSTSSEVELGKRKIIFYKEEDKISL